ncbi:hypothetical protein TW95_gp0245 [Pandoravirus inopinatum]|uniref:Uncharacterized protein n=1 Tax=Pandoravirus inopinatum TaxID=1605721 RepID=A0A0B5J0I0_9VIRU|nr:hypothetical protein TW95_gp0245 [Pandoravirus inopinatum]AJF96979.1 hypothetical protein [Pandoravirus inopinatum]
MRSLYVALIASLSWTWSHCRKKKVVDHCTRRPLPLGKKMGRHGAAHTSLNGEQQSHRSWTRSAQGRTAPQPPNRRRRHCVFCACNLWRRAFFVCGRLCLFCNYSFSFFEDCAIKE